MSALGKPIDRRDGRLKVTGTARFAAEYPVEKVAHAALVTSTIARGRIRRLDTAEAERAPGVRVVLTHRNAPPMKETAVFDPAASPPGAAATSAKFLQSEEIMWNGQPVAVVVADTLEQARRGAELVRAEYEEQPPRIDLHGGIEHAYVPENVIGEPPEVRIGEADAALAQAEVKVDLHFTTPPENHHPIEPHAIIAQWEGDKLTVYDSTQFIVGIQKMLSEKFGIPMANVRVISSFVGGGFGCKGLAWPHVALCVAAARAAKRPVKLSLTRQQVARTVGGRPATDQRVALGASRDGKLSVLIHTGITTTSTSNIFTEQFTFPARHLYTAPNMLLGQKITKLDIVPPTFMRAPGETPGTFALESALDELSYALSLDPVELRLRNITDKDPTTGAPYSIRFSREMYELGAEKFGWAKRNPQPRSMREGRWLVGYGMATAYYPVYQMPSAARVRVNADGTAVGASAAHEMGMGTSTAQAQNLANALGLAVEKVTFEHGDSRLPFAAVAGGSSQTISVGAAVLAACEEVKKKLLALAQQDTRSPFRGVKIEDVEIRDGALFAKGDGQRSATFSDILRKAGKQNIEAEAEGMSKSAPAPDSRPSTGDAEKQEQRTEEKLSKGSYGAQFVEVRIDEALGKLRVARVVSAFDVGKVLNEKTAKSQFRGGIIMGIGMALMEETLFEPTRGRILNPNLAEYHVPTHADIPEIEIHYLDKPDPHTPMGAHGIGEIGITGVAAAIANAVYHATGKRIREVPITPEKLLA